MGFAHLAAQRIDIISVLLQMHDRPGRILSAGRLHAAVTEALAFNMTGKIKAVHLADIALLLAIAAVSLYIRIALPYGAVFTPDIIKFTGIDAYYHMRLVDNIAYNFPTLTPFDPYAIFPGGAATGSSPDLFAYFVAAMARLFSPGGFSQQGVDTIAAYVPPVLGTLVIIPLYFIGKAVFNRWAGLLAAAVFVVLPGAVGRSLLGFTDQHVAEVLISALLMMFLVFSLKSGTAELTGREGWKPLMRPLIYAACAGACLGVYFLTWAGALIFVLLLFIFFLVQFTLDHMRGKPTLYLALAGCVSGAVALLIMSSWRFDMLSFVPLIIFTLFPAIMFVLSKYMRSRGWNALFFPSSVLALGLLAAAVIFLISPSFLRGMVELAGRVFIPQLATTNMEMQPLFFTLGRFTWDAVFDSFTTCFYLGLIALGILAYRTVKNGESLSVLLVVWSIFMLLLTLSMRRFAYYYVVNVALLIGYLCWLALSLAGLGKKTQPAAPENLRAAPARSRKKRTAAKRSPSRPAWIYPALAILAVAVLVFYPNFGPLPGGARPVSDMAVNPSFAPSDAWCESLSWMRKNTTEPLGDADAWYRLWPRPAAGQEFEYPDTAYGVLSWWDTGYWIERIGRRIPMTNPGRQEVAELVYASFFLSEDETQAAKILQEGGAGYVIIDFDTALPLKFHSIAAATGGGKEKYYDVFYRKQEQGGGLSAFILFYPEYYRTMIARLYNFNGGAAVEKDVTVLSYKDAVDQSGQKYKQVADYRTFKTYVEAQAYMSQQKGGNYRIGGVDPFISPVTLAPLDGFTLEHGSADTSPTPSGAPVPTVKIFKYSSR